MGKKKLPKVLIIGDFNQKLFILDQKALMDCNQIMVKNPQTALLVAARHPSYFDILIVDSKPQKVNREDFIENFRKLSPKTQIIYRIS